MADDKRSSASRKSYPDRAFFRENHRMSATPRGPSGRPRLLVLAVLSLATLVTTAEPAYSQGAFRRLGDRIRERIGGPIIPSGPIQPPANRSTGELPSSPLGRAAAAKPPVQPVQPVQPVEAQRSANFRRAVARTPEAPKPGPRTAIQSPESADRDRWAARNPPPPPTPGKVSTDATQYHARSGLMVAPPAAVAAPGLPPRRPRGAQIIEIQPNSPAAAAGLKPDDRIVAIDGRLVNSVDDLVRQLETWEPTRNLAVQVSRNDRLHTARLSSASPDAIAGSAAGEPGVNRAASGQTPGGNRSILGGFGAAIGGLLGNRNQPAEVVATDAAVTTAEDAGTAVDPAAALTPIDSAPLATSQPEPIAAPLPEPRPESDERR